MKALFGFIMFVVVFSVIVACAGGWFTNVLRFAKADFEEPYKNEIIRGIGIPFVPMGIVLGYCHIDDTPKKE